jgi:hypothetical protein
VWSTKRGDQARQGPLSLPRSSRASDLDRSGTIYAPVVHPPGLGGKSVSMSSARRTWAPPGQGWFRKGQPAGRRATYTHITGLRQMFGALKLSPGQLFHRFATANAAGVLGLLSGAIRCVGRKRSFEVTTRHRGAAEAVLARAPVRRGSRKHR